jgi:hypothetical protein
MQPLQIPQQQPPVTPWAQLLFRLREKNPKFFNWLSLNSFYFSAFFAALPWAVNTLCPILEIEPPVWLSYSNRVCLGITALLSGAGLGSIFASQAALTGPTPPLVTEAKKPEDENIAALVAKAVAEQMAPYRANQPQIKSDL